MSDQRIQQLQARIEALERELSLHHRYRRLFERSLPMLAIADFEGRFVDLSASWQACLGYGLEQLTSQPFIHFVHPEDVASTLAETSALASHRTETVAFENRYRHCDGHYRWFSWKASADREAGYIYAMAEDVTEHRETLARLRRSEAMLNQSQRIAKLGGWALDAATHTVEWSDEVYRIHERPIGDMPSLEQAINYYAPEARPVIAARVREGLEHGTPWDLELGLITEKGRRRWVRAMGTFDPSITAN